jgi:thiol:disulfide interchange protein
MKRPMLVAALLVAGLPTLAAAQTAVVSTPHMRAELLAHAPQGVGPGKPLWFGLSLQHAPHWHTYWKNAGDSGLPTAMSWQLPSGVQTFDIAWPTPKQLKLGPLMNYGYEDTVLLPVPVSLSGDFSAPTLAVKLRADWLVCKEVCIPESGEFTLTLLGTTAVVEHQDKFTAALARVPRVETQAIAKGRVEGQALLIEVNGLAAADQGKSYLFFPETGGAIEPAAPIQQSWNGSTWSARVPLSAQRSESPSQMQAVLVAGAATGTQVRIDITGPWPSAAPSTSAANTSAAPMPAEPSTPLLATLGLALLGGLLLNLMPCVFPVLSLKLLSFAQPGQRRRDRVSAGLAYTGGVLVSFVALAGLLLVLRAGGEQLGWGLQLQSPLFVAALALLFTLIGLNLAGLFELRGGLPGNLAAARARHPLADHALTGALAVAVASPCTGPFMGVALGSALTLPAVQALLVFAALGLGMALPYLAIALLPGIARHLPRPGAWMQRFKVAMAFPMFATVLWLVWVLGQQVGIDGAVGVLAVLLATALVGWAIGTPGVGRRARGVGSVLATVIWLATLAWAWPALREPAASPSAAAPAPATGSAWQPWSADMVARARAQGRPVFVDFTAAWCVTCQYNKRSALADAGVLADFAAQNVLLLRADWTRRDAAITQELARLGRSGVPVYALYGPATGLPTLLPEILRASALRQALAAMQTSASRPTPPPV